MFYFLVELVLVCFPAAGVCLVVSSFCPDPVGTVKWGVDTEDLVVYTFFCFYLFVCGGSGGFVVVVVLVCLFLLCFVVIVF